MKCAIDLYSGIGGWTLGMKLSGIESLASYEWWYEANQTHNLNFGTNHKEINIRDINVEKDLNYSRKIDFIVGSPPCTQFSFANKGGNGNIQEGLIDIYKFLEVVEFLKPKYWVMENVPRVAGILEKELNGGTLSRFRSLVKSILIVDTSEYGVPQNRKRMIAGDFPVELFNSYKQKITLITLGQVLSSLSKEIVKDPNYGYEIPRQDVTELENEVNLTQEETRINRDSKTYHPVYNNMSFPDKLDRPSRTVTATCTRVSRESIIIDSKNGFRRLNVREKGVLQGFPITYQFYGKTLNSKFKMIGNAVPPILTYYIFQSMLEVQPCDIKHPSSSSYFHEKPHYTAFKSNLGLPARKYPLNRKFQFSVPNLRFGSGVRFELSNNPKSKIPEWSFKFFFGNSKNIKQIALNNDIRNSLNPIVNASNNIIFSEYIDVISKQYEELNCGKLQAVWTSNSSGSEVFDFLDHIGSCIKSIIERVDLSDIDVNIIESIVNEKNKKLEENKISLLVGFYFLSSLNNIIFNR
ncbi:MAG: DNA (cytosine-5-)-methyltransferase [Bacteroidetes bacterium]|nr:DNA (cytosine-5-)-methyltransferase [Bacteroidota bacterium]